MVKHNWTEQEKELLTRKINNGIVSGNLPTLDELVESIERSPSGIVCKIRQFAKAKYQGITNEIYKKYKNEAYCKFYHTHKNELKKAIQDSKEKHKIAGAYLQKICEEYCKKNNIKQIEIAKKTDVNYYSLSNWFSGIKPKLVNIRKFAIALEMNPDEVVSNYRKLINNNFDKQEYGRS